MAKNIQSAALEAGIWNPADLKSSLTDLLRYVEAEARNAVDWYMQKKRSKSVLSRTIQLGAVVLTALAGIFPILSEILGFKTFSSGSGLWASVFVGLAAALLALDRAFGFSSGWSRYVLTATSIRGALEEFRLDWTSLLAKAADPPSSEQCLELIQRAKEFITKVEGLVLQETKNWATEFQNNIAQLEKDAGAQLDALKAEVDKAAQARAAAAQPGSIEATVSDADKADAFRFHVRLDNAEGKVVEETVTNSKSWVHVNISPGQYKMSVSAMAAAKPVSAARAVIIKPSEVARPVVSLLP